VSGQGSPGRPFARRSATLPLFVLRQFFRLCLGHRCRQTIALAELDLRNRNGNTASTESEKAAHIHKDGLDLPVGSHHNVFDVTHVAS
jgi:hypothetical protein